MRKMSWFSIALLCSIGSLAQSPQSNALPPNPSYGDHLLHIYTASQDELSITSKKQLQERLHTIVNFYDTWATEKEVGKPFSDLLFYLVIDLHETGHPHYPFYHQHCSEAVRKGEMKKEPCEVIGFLRG